MFMYKAVLKVEMLSVKLLNTEIEEPQSLARSFMAMAVRQSGSGLKT
jgi:hypothetical protein